MTRLPEISCKLTHCALSTPTPYIAWVMGDVEGEFAASEAGALDALATKLRDLAEQADAQAAKARRNAGIVAPMRRNRMLQQVSQEGGAA